MKKKVIPMKSSLLVVAIMLAAALQTQVVGGTVSPVQSSARPFGLEIAGLVQLAGSDAQAADFMQNSLPGLRASVEQNLSEKSPLPNVSNLALDPSALQLQYDANVRAYFIGEGAGYHNTLGFMTTPYSASDGIGATDAKLIFPDASSPRSYLSSRANGGRTTNTPLLEGDFVDLGSFDAGTSINPFIVANGANGGTNIFTAFDNENVDGLQHFVSLAVEGSPFLLIGVEDLLGGGDLDYNDVVFVLDVGEENVSYLVSQTVPLPPAALALAIPALALTFRRNRS